MCAPLSMSINVLHYAKKRALAVMNCGLNCKSRCRFYCLRAATLHSLHDLNAAQHYAVFMIFLLPSIMQSPYAGLEALIGNRTLPTKHASVPVLLAPALLLLAKYQCRDCGVFGKPASTLWMNIRHIHFAGLHCNCRRISNLVEGP